MNDLVAHVHVSLTDNEPRSLWLVFLAGPLEKVPDDVDDRVDVRRRVFHPVDRVDDRRSAKAQGPVLRVYPGAVSHAWPRALPAFANRSAQPGRRRSIAIVAGGSGLEGGSYPPEVVSVEMVKSAKRLMNLPGRHRRETLYVVAVDRVVSA